MPVVLYHRNTIKTACDQNKRDSRRSSFILRSETRFFEGLHEERGKLEFLCCPL